MGKEHHLAQRRQKILTVIEAAGQVSVVELSARFNVSEVTIRQDLQALSEQGVLLRTRGGAVSTNTCRFCTEPLFGYQIIDKLLP